MSITPSSYKKIKNVKTWITETLPTVSEDTYQEIVKDLLQYLDDIVTNDSFFSADIKAIITELNKLLSQTHPSQSDIDKVLSEAKTYADKKSTESLDQAKQFATQLHTSTNKTITALTASVNANTTNITKAQGEISKVASNVTKTDARIDTVMSTHKQKIKDTITGAMEEIKGGTQ